MANTITSFTTFVAGTNARAEQVNNNFSNFRGVMVPINPDTQTASNLLHGLGTSDHRFAESFIREINFGDTTASWKIKDTTTTSADLGFYHGQTSPSLLFRLTDNYDQTAEISQQICWKINGSVKVNTGLDGGKGITRPCTVRTIRYVYLNGGASNSVTSFLINKDGVSVTTFDITGAGDGVVVQGSITLTAFSITSANYLTLDCTQKNDGKDIEIKLF